MARVQLSVCTLSRFAVNSPKTPELSPHFRLSCRGQKHPFPPAHAHKILNPNVFFLSFLMNTSVLTWLFGDFIYSFNFNVLWAVQLCYRYDRKQSYSTSVDNNDSDFKMNSLKLLRFNFRNTYRFVTSEWKEKTHRKRHSKTMPHSTLSISPSNKRKKVKTLMSKTLKE